MAQFRAVWRGYPRPILWRNLTWSEHRKLEALPVTRVARSLEAYRLSLVDGPSLTEVPFGIAYWIGHNELENSPFSGNYKPLVQALDSARAWLQNDYLNAAQAVVAWTFRYLPEEIEHWPPEKLFRRLAQAEFIFNRPMDPADPGAKPKTDEEVKRDQRKTVKKSEQLDRLQRVLERRRQNSAAGMK